MKNQLEALLNQALASLKTQGLLPADFQTAIQLERTKDKTHGDWATNIALMSAKAAGKKPRDIAEALIAALPIAGIVGKVEIAGPGFINFFLAEDFLGRQLQAALRDAHLNIPAAKTPQTVVVDYSGPNLAKEMHVGHLRSTIIGDAVVRTLEFLGHNVIRQNHVGDWGTQFGMLIAYLEEQPATGNDAALADLEVFYRAAKKRFDESEEFAKRARALVVALQGGDADCLAKWREFTRTSLKHCLDVYQRLGVSLSAENVRGESAYNPDLSVVVTELKKTGLLRESEGAQCVFLDEFKNKEGEPLPVIVQKADGGYLYATSDLAALRYRQQTLGANRILYFVDQRQALHFQQVFTVAKLAGFVKADTALTHLGFGTMNGPDGKPFKTRDGGTVKLIDLLDEAEQRALDLVREKNPQLDEISVKEIAGTVGIASVKYADLSKNRTSDYIFNFDQMLSFEGNTAPYLLYAYTRVAAIFRRAEINPDTLTGDLLLQAPQEQELGNKLLQFSEVLEVVAQKGLPNLLCNYLYELAGTFSAFYEQCPVLTAESEALKQSRLQLSWLTARTLKSGLGLLGIQTLERM